MDELQCVIKYNVRHWFLSFKMHGRGGPGKLTIIQGNLSIVLRFDLCRLVCMLRSLCLDLIIDSFNGTLSWIPHEHTQKKMAKVPALHMPII